MQSEIYALLEKEDSARNARAAALESKEAGAQCLEFLKDKNHLPLDVALPFKHFKKGKNRILTNGSRRLTKFFRERIYAAIE